ncbi:hypothetical protein ACFFK0_04755 [Paenibacillus chartarius]|uniref:Uncharacterized protein n=1 Tax=Paenibacillus chartarius TaxID=747481 RepID=A0ABV6DGK0_9BACL
MSRLWIAVPLVYLIAAAGFGLYMRIYALYPMPSVNYVHVLHAHSHLAMLGWGYVALTLLLTHEFWGEEAVRGRSFRIQFGVTQAVVVPMTAAFLMQGYAAWSIAFSSIHIILNYVYMAWFRLQSRRAVNGRALGSSAADRKPASLRYAQGALLCLLLSSFGPWTLAVLGATGRSDTIYFNDAVYAYLHVQYNGWFLLGLAALLLARLDKLGTPAPYSQLTAIRLYRLFMATLLPSILLSFTADLNTAGKMVALLAGLLQLVFVCGFLLLFVKAWLDLRRARSFSWSERLGALALFCLLLKAALDPLPALPGLAPLVAGTRSLVIAYLHLALLGFISLLLLALFGQRGWIPARSRFAAWGAGLIAAGFLANESVLALQSVQQWRLAPIAGGDWLLAAAAAVMLMGAILLLAGAWRTAAD